MSDTENTGPKIGAIEWCDLTVPDAGWSSLLIFRFVFHNSGNSNLLALRVD